MIEIRFSAPHSENGRIEWELVALLRVDGTQLTIDGDQDFADACDIEVLDIDSGQTVTFDADPERWARNLPYAFRSGDLVCEIAHDDAVETYGRRAIAARA